MDFSYRLGTTGWWWRFAPLNCSSMSYLCTWWCSLIIITCHCVPHLYISITLWFLHCFLFILPLFPTAIGTPAANLMGLLTNALSPNRFGGTWELLTFNCSKSLSKIPRKSLSKWYFLSFEVLFNWKDGFKEYLHSRLLPSVENFSSFMMSTSSPPLQSCKPQSLRSHCPWTYPRCWSRRLEKKRASPAATFWNPVMAEILPHPTQTWLLKLGNGNRI